MERGGKGRLKYLGLDVQVQVTAERGRGKSLVAERAVAILGCLGGGIQQVVVAVLAALAIAIARGRGIASDCAGGRRRGSRHRGRGRFGHGFFLLALQISVESLDDAIHLLVTGNDLVGLDHFASHRRVLNVSMPHPERHDCTRSGLGL